MTIDSPLTAALPDSRRVRLPAWLEANALALGSVGLFALLVAITAPQQLVQDSWLTLLSGREIVQHGLPHHDDLFVWTSGREWVDQQWLGQLAYYGLYLLGGVRVMLLAHATFIVGAAAIMVAASRRRGASAAAVFLTGFVCFLMAPWTLQLRAQSLAELLFAACFVLLLDERPPTGRRLAAILALLVVWANVHGTVVLGVLFAVVRGAILVARRQRSAGLVLAALAPCCVFASPYGLDLAGYYRRMLANPLLARYVGEWHRSVPSVSTAAFYLALLASAWLFVKRRRRWTLFEKLALALLAVGGVQALRGIVWFGLAAVPILAPRLDGLIGRQRLLRGAVAARAGVAIVAAGAVVAGVVYAHPSGWFLRAWPSQAARAAAAAAVRDPQLRVFADDRYADWLLWSQPRLRGRIAYDIRFELFTERQLQALGRYRATRVAPRPGDPLHGYGLYVSEAKSPSCFSGRCRRLYRDASVVVARS